MPRPPLDTGQGSFFGDLVYERIIPHGHSWSP